MTIQRECRAALADSLPRDALVVTLYCGSDRVARVMLVGEDQDPLVVVIGLPSHWSDHKGRRRPIPERQP